MLLMVCCALAIPLRIASSKLPGDVEVILSFVRGLARYEEAEDEVVATTDDLTAALDGQWGDLGPVVQKAAAGKIAEKAKDVASA